MSNDYHFVTHWRVEGSLEDVKAILGYAPALPRWWPAVYLSVDVIEPGAPDAMGAVVDLHTKGWLPYTLKWRLSVVEPVTDTGFALTASGDLEGAGHWTFAVEGASVLITYDWRVHASKPLLRRLGWLLKPAFSANHTWAMRKGEESLQLEIRRRNRAEGDPPVPDPPPPTFRFLMRGH